MPNIDKKVRGNGLWSISLILEKGNFVWIDKLALQINLDKIYKCTKKHDEIWS